MTPVAIDVLLHYYVNPSPHPNLDAPAVREAIEFWVMKEILEPSTNVVTTHGEEYIKTFLKAAYDLLPRRKHTFNGDIWALVEAIKGSRHVKLELEMCGKDITAKVNGDNLVLGQRIWY